MASNHSLKVLAEKIFGKRVKISSLNKLLNEINITRKLSPCIFNTAEEGVGHFIAAAPLDERSVVLFDPLASKITEIIMEPLNNIFNNVYINHDQIQDEESEFCALFCLGFINHFLKGGGMSSYFEMFTKDNLRYNDQVIYDYLMLEIVKKKKIAM